MSEDWLLAGAQRDRQSITSDWQLVNQRLIDGVQLKEVRNVIKENGVLCEVWRRSWALDELDVGQVFQVRLRSGGLSAWHAHQFATDRLFVNEGLIKVVLYDHRPGSPTHGLINEFRVGSARPALIVVPPQVWHGVQNLSDQPSALLNVVDRPYDYEAPDHWRIPADSDQIPYRFDTASARSDRLDAGVRR